MLQHPTPVFIVGSGRSGTTITASLLSHLPRVQIAKETGYISQNLSLLRDIDNPSSLHRLIEEVNSWLTHSHWENIASADGFRRFCSQYDFHGCQAFIHYVWQLDSRKPWHELSFVGDNTPLYVLAIPAILELMPNAHFIHMVRDPRDVVTSTLKMRFGADDPILAPTEWHMLLGSWLWPEPIVSADRRSSAAMNISAQNSETTVTRLAKFLMDAEEDARRARPTGVDRSEPQYWIPKVAAAGSSTRLTQPLAASRVGRFRSELTIRQIQAIEAVAQDGFFAYGFTLTGPREHPLMRENRMCFLKAAIRDLSKRCMKRLRRT